MSAQGVDERMINVHYYYYRAGSLSMTLDRVILSLLTSWLTTKQCYCIAKPTEDWYFWAVDIVSNNTFEHTPEEAVLVRQWLKQWMAWGIQRAQNVGSLLPNSHRRRHGVWLRGTDFRLHVSFFLWKRSQQEL